MNIVTVHGGLGVCAVVYVMELDVLKLVVEMYLCVCVCVCVCVCARARACVCVWGHAWLHMLAHVRVSARMFSQYNTFQGVCLTSLE